MKHRIILSILILLVLGLSTPFSASAATKAGIKPGSFWYAFDRTFERVSLFFTRDPEKKAQKVLAYADERLAEAEALVEEGKNTNAIEATITDYERNIAFVAEKSKEVKDKGKAEGLLASIAENTAKHQETLAVVLGKVPEDAKEAVLKAIEASKKGQEEATLQIAELKHEVEQLKKEIAELKSKEVNSPKEPTEEKTTEALRDVKFESQQAKQEAEKARLEAERLKQEVEQMKAEAEKQERARKAAEDLERQAVAYRQRQSEEVSVQSQRESEMQRQQESLKKQQEVLQQDNLKKQQELSREKELYQQKTSELNDLIFQLNDISNQKRAAEESLLAAENDYIVTYCKNKETELTNNYATRGLAFSGMHKKAIEDLKVTCPIEARNLYRAYLNETTYPLVVQLENMKVRFQRYNQDLYSRCSQYSFGNCSVYLDAAFPIR